jgi:hypothetical protein
MDYAMADPTRLNFVPTGATRQIVSRHVMHDPAATLQVRPVAVIFDDATAAGTTQTLQMAFGARQRQLEHWRSVIDIVASVRTRNGDTLAGLEQSLTQLRAAADAGNPAARLAAQNLTATREAIVAGTLTTDDPQRGIAAMLRRFSDRVSHIVQHTTRQ